MSIELVRRALEYTDETVDSDVQDEELAEVFAPDVVLDLSTRVFNPKVYVGYDGLREFRSDVLEIWESLSITATELTELAP